MEDEDRISELGDEILLQILSSINIKEAVQTSILSKRWKSLWTSMSDLNFNLNSMALLSGLHINHPFDGQCFMPIFTRFVIQFLSHRDHTSIVRKFQLSGNLLHTDPTSVVKWVEYAINHGVQHLHLNFSWTYRVPFNFPAAFCCQTIRQLRLTTRPGYGCVIPKPLILPNLNSLHLERFTFNDDDDDDDDNNDYYFPEEPFSGFPNLEKLSLHDCRVSRLVILSSKLRILELNFKNSFSLIEVKSKMKQISTPSLTSLRYEGHFPLECPRVDFSCLEKVYLDICTDLMPHYTATSNKEIFINSVKMLQQLGNAKSVTLTLDTTEVLETDPVFLEQRQSPFPNMERLKVMKGCHGVDAVLQSVMNYLLINNESVVVELPRDVSVIEKRIPVDPFIDHGELGLQHLFT